MADGALVGDDLGPAVDSHDKAASIFDTLRKRRDSIQVVDDALILASKNNNSCQPASPTSSLDDIRNTLYHSYPAQDRFQSFIEHVKMIEARASDKNCPVASDGKRYQDLIDDIYRSCGVVIGIYSCDSLKEVRVAGGSLRAGDVEFLKITPSDYLHFMVHHSLDYRNSDGFMRLDTLCNRYALHYNRNARSVIRLMDDCGGLLVAELFSKSDDRHCKVSGKGKIIPYDSIALHRNNLLEGRLLRDLVTQVYHASVE